MQIVRRQIDTGIEDKIITAMIVSKRFLLETKDIFSPDYLKNTYTRKVAHWATEFYDYYGEAPGKQIKDIFDIEGPNLEGSEKTIIGELLTKLSRQFEEEEGINEPFYIDKAVEYFKLREMEITARNVLKLTELGRVAEAEKEMARHRKVERLTSGWFNPLGDDCVSEVFDETSSDKLFTMPGAVGELVGELERGWLIAILGAYKRGKTFWMKEINTIALTHKLKVAELSLEMKKANLNSRFYKRLLAAGDAEKTRFAYPCYDCAANQRDDCAKPARKNRSRLLDADGQKPEFNPTIQYRVCTVCKGSEDYEPETWYEVFERPTFSYLEVQRSVKGFKSMYGAGNYRAKVYPRFSAGLSDIKRDLDLLERTEGFVPDVISIDYADILKPEGAHASQAFVSLDDIWKGLAGLAAERHALVVTGSQATTAALSKPKAGQEDVRGWRDKIGHVDVMLALNQTGVEKKAGVMRLNLIAHRHMEYHEDQFCNVLQQLSTGQVELDSMLQWGHNE